MTKSISKKDLRFAVVATDAVLLAFVENKLSVLLIEPTNPDYKGKLALIGGLVLPTETADVSVSRHLKTKAGINPDFKEQIYTFSELNRDTRGRVISIAYLALIRPSKAYKKSESASWVPIKKAKNLAYDHDDILKTAIKHLQRRILESDIIRYLMPIKFTLTDLQKAYEEILNTKLDKRNFRKKILSLDIIEETGELSSGAHRPAKLYRFSKKRHQSISPF